jgi:hypothetical protein
MGAFNNREIATAIWMLLLFIFTLTKKDVRRSLSDVVKSFFHIKIVVPLLLMIIYVLGIVLVLYKIKFWNFSMLKDSIVWFCFTAIIVIFNSMTSNTNESLFRKNIIDSFKIVMVIEFIVNTYTFSLIGELFFVPFMALIVILDVVAKSDDQYKPVAKLLSIIQIIIGIYVLIYATSTGWSIMNP